MGEADLLSIPELSGLQHIEHRLIVMTDLSGIREGTYAFASSNSAPTSYGPVTGISSRRCSSVEALKEIASFGRSMPLNEGSAPSAPGLHDNEA